MSKPTLYIPQTNLSFGSDSFQVLSYEEHGFSQHQISLQFDQLSQSNIDSPETALLQQKMTLMEAKLLQSQKEVEKLKLERERERFFKKIILKKCQEKDKVIFQMRQKSRRCYDEFANLGEILKGMRRRSQYLSQKVKLLEKLFKLSHEVNLEEVSLEKIGQMVENYEGRRVLRRMEENSWRRNNLGGEMRWRGNTCSKYEGMD